MLQLQNKTPIKIPIIKIFLTVRHKNELKQRLIGRGEKQVKLRLKRYGYEQKQKNKFDFMRLFFMVQMYNYSLVGTSNKYNKPQQSVLSVYETVC